MEHSTHCSLIDFSLFFKATHAHHKVGLICHPYDDAYENHFIAYKQAAIRQVVAVQKVYGSPFLNISDFLSLNFDLLHQIILINITTELRYLTFLEF